jgi:hypothetical protein
MTGIADGSEQVVKSEIVEGVSCPAAHFTGSQIPPFAATHPVA